MIACLRPDVLSAVRLAVRGPNTAGASVEHLRTAKPDKADILRVCVGGHRVIVKDFARKSRLQRFFGRFQIWRECEAYRRLGAVQGVPEFFGRVDEHALAMQEVCGVELSRWPDVRDRAVLMERVGDVVRRIHAAGLVHLDLRCKSNIRVLPDREIRILDFASAIWFRPNALESALLFPLLRRIDESAVLKFKQRLSLPLTSREARAMENFGFWRILWGWVDRVRGRLRGRRRAERPGRGDRAAP